MGLIDIVLETETISACHNQPLDIDEGLIDFVSEAKSGCNLDRVHLLHSRNPHTPQ